MRSGDKSSWTPPPRPPIFSNFNSPVKVNHYLKAQTRQRQIRTLGRSIYDPIINCPILVCSEYLFCFVFQTRLFSLEMPTLTAEISSKGKRPAVEGGKAVSEWGAWDPTKPLL